MTPGTNSGPKYRTAVATVLMNILLVGNALQAHAGPPAISDVAPGSDVDLLRIIVLDVSGSMSSSDTDGRSRLDTARREILQMLQSLPASERTPVVLLPFSNEVRQDRGGSYKNDAKLRQALEKLRADGSTNIAAALEAAIDQARKAPDVPHLMVLLYSDGEHTDGSMELVHRQEDRLDRLFGDRATRGLSQTVVVKRWGGVIADMVARLQKDPNVGVVDAGELRLQTVTLVPSAAVHQVSWRDASSGIADIGVMAAVRTTGQPEADCDATVTMSCPLPGVKWNGKPLLKVNDRSGPRLYRLSVKVDPDRLAAGSDCAIPLVFGVPRSLRTRNGVTFLMLNPDRILCRLPAGSLLPRLRLKAGLTFAGQCGWEEPEKDMAFWKLKLALVPRIEPALAEVETNWRAQPLDGTRIDAVGLIPLSDSPVEVELTASRKLSGPQLADDGRTSVRLQLTAERADRCRLLANRLVVETSLPRPPIRTTRVCCRPLPADPPSWWNLTRLLITVPVRLEVTVDGPLTPKAILGLVAPPDVVAVEGLPARIRPGRQVLDLCLTGKAHRPGQPTSWQLRFESPRPVGSIRYEPISPASVNFVAPGPVQVILAADRRASEEGAYRGSDPAREILAEGTVAVTGGPDATRAAHRLRVNGSLKDPITGQTFAGAAIGDEVRWSMRPSDPACSVQWWRDVRVEGDLLVLPENAPPTAVVGSVVKVAIVYEALYKKMAFYLAISLGLLLLAGVLFQLMRMCFGAHRSGDG